MSAFQTPEEQRYALRESKYDNSREEAIAIEEGDRAIFDRVDPLERHNAAQAVSLCGAADEAVEAAMNLHVQVRTFAEQIRSGEVALTPETAREAERHRHALLQSVGALEPYVGRLNHSITVCSDPFAAYSRIVSRYPSLRR